jgi:hypothetical protein
LQARDWFSDCSALMVRHICRVASVVALALSSAFFWYATRIEANSEAVQDALQKIQIDVAIIRGRQEALLPERIASNE